MRKQITVQRQSKHFFSRHHLLIALLLHLLVLLFIMTHISWRWEVEPPKPPHDYVPSYVYKGAVSPAPKMTHQAMAQAAQQPKQPDQPVPDQTAKQQPPSIRHNAQQYATKKSSHFAKQSSIMDLSRATLAQNTISHAINNMSDEEPMLMIGDMSMPADPLIKMLGRSLSAHFSYPKLEGNFGIRGRVVVSMILHPEGYFSDVQLVESSDNADFDNAALYAVNSAPKLIGADRFIDKPKHFIVGFVFD